MGRRLTPINADKNMSLLIRVHPRSSAASCFLLALLMAAALAAQTPPAAPTHADILRGEYGPYRANNDLLFYHLDVRVDPEKKYLSWDNVVFKEPLSHGREFSKEEIWENYTYFIKQVAPVAEEAGVRIGIHPDDPPVPVLAGVPRCIFANFR